MRNEYVSRVERRKNERKEVMTYISKIIIVHLIYIIFGLSSVNACVSSYNIICSIDKFSSLSTNTMSEYVMGQSGINIYIPDEEKNIVLPEEKSVIEESVSNINDFSLPSKFDSVPLDGNLKEYIYTSAKDANIPPEILFGMAWKESTFNPNVSSTTNDHGLFQINDCNFQRLAEIFGLSYNEFCIKIYDPYFNTDCAVYILSEYRDNYNNDNWHHVLMRYNMGPTGANRKFNEGIYSSEYSRAIINYAQENYNFTNINL